MPRTAVKDCGYWPTPTVGDSVGARNRTSGRSSPNSKHHDGVTLCDAITPGKSGSLNPTWVEWLMGYPTGWTDLEPSETP